MRRRDFVKAVAISTAAGAVTATAQAQVGGPFAMPTVRFKPGAQHLLPNWAFRDDLHIPAVPLPTAIGRYEELIGKAVFGPGDIVPIGESFHGVASEWGETPLHWKAYGCDPTLKLKASWEDKQNHFLTVPAHDGSGAIDNWSGFQIKCYKVTMEELNHPLRPDATFPARLYTFNGTVPGPLLKMRLGEPVVVRFENQLEAEISVHLHGGHSPSHSDGFPSFYVLQGKSRDYFYPNMLPLFPKADKPAEYDVDVGESQSTMWYHDHAMDATAYNVSKGMAGVAPCFGERELALIRDHTLPGYGPRSCVDYTNIRYNAKPRAVQFNEETGEVQVGGETTVEELLKQLEDPKNPGYFKRELEPYYNPFDIPLVIQDKVIDLESGQIAYDLTDHNGYLGDTFFVNGVAWPKLDVRNRKFRFRLLDGSNARVYRLRIMKAEDFWKAQRFGIDALNDPQKPIEALETPPGGVAPEIAGNHLTKYDQHSAEFLRIGKDSWLWSEAVTKRSIVLAMANRADIVVDFGALTAKLVREKKLAEDWETQEYVLVNTMPQFDGRGPKAKLEDGGDPRVLPVPFDLPGQPLVELTRPIGLMKFVVHREPAGSAGDPPGDIEAKVVPGTPLIKTHREITDKEIVAVREFIFERGKGAWQINGRFYDPYIANAAPLLDGAEEWVLRNGGGGWWHPIHIHLESHQLISYEKDFLADAILTPIDPPPRNELLNKVPLFDRGKPGDPKINQLDRAEAMGLHDTQVLGPNTVARIRMRHRTWNGPFVFHCHNLEHEDMRMMHNFEPVPAPHDPNTAPAARTHGNDVTLDGIRDQFDQHVGEPPWHHAAVPKTPVQDAGQEQIPPRDKPQN